MKQLDLQSFIERKPLNRSALHNSMLRDERVVSLVKRFAVELERALECGYSATKIELTQDTACLKCEKILIFSAYQKKFFLQLSAGYEFLLEQQGSLKNFLSILLDRKLFTKHCVNFVSEENESLKCDEYTSLSFRVIRDDKSCKIKLLLPNALSKKLNASAKAKSNLRLAPKRRNLMVKAQAALFIGVDTFQVFSNMRSGSRIKVTSLEKLSLFHCRQDGQLNHSPSVLHTFAMVPDNFNGGLSCRLG